LRGDYAGYGNDIASAARHLSSVIHEMSSPGQNPNGEEAGETRTIDLTALAAEALVLVEAQAEERQVAIRFDAPRSLRALGQERAVIQILVNLIGNAIRYSGQGGTVEILFAQGEHTASLSVRDEGPGIDPADQQRIFERFERADPETKDGTGLGLAISRRLARSMGGDIGLESKAGEGALFTLVLPSA
jgi:signal transduction histidine kinase